MVACSTGERSNFFAVALNDLNKDGYLDIVAANRGTDSIGVLLGHGDGTFASQVTYPTGYYSQPVSVAIGDFNHDDQLDIATANNNIGRVGILLGYGNGTFSDVTLYSSGDGSAPAYVSLGDFNNDQNLDIAVMNYRSDDLVVLFGVGDGSFLLGKTYTAGVGSSSGALVIGDFNNDSRLDIASVSPTSRDIGIFLGNGNEPFAGVFTLPTGEKSQPHSVAVADFYHDGQADIAVANYSTSNVGIFLGYGNGSFSSMTNYSSGINFAPNVIAVSDLNQDNHSDIIVVNSETDNIVVFLGLDNGTFVMAATHRTGDRSRPFSIIITNFDNDSIPDIAIANSGTNNVLVLYGYGDGTFGRDNSYALGYSFQPYAIASADLNQDGWMDMIIAYCGTDNVETFVTICQ